MKSYSLPRFATCLLVAFFALAASTSIAQSSREYIRNCIQNYGECHNVAITKTNGDAMLYGSNGWAASHCPDAFVSTLRELNGENVRIVDIQLTENGNWLVLYGSNGLRWNGISYSLEQQLREYNRDQEEITSVSFNDRGDWIVVTTNYISASDSEITNWMSEGMEIYGKVWATCVTDDAIVVVYEEGFRFRGNIPETLREALSNTDINVYRLKIAGNSWFFSDGVSRYDYYM